MGVSNKQGSSRGGRGGEDIPGEGDFPAVAPPTYEPSHVIQLLMETQREAAGTSVKVDRLIEDVKKIHDQVDQIRHSLTWAKGFGISAMILIPICGAVIWWIIGGQLTQLRNDLLRNAPTAAAAPQQPVQTQQPPVKP